MLTVEQIKAAAKEVKPIADRPGVFFLKPSVEIVEISTGKIFHAEKVDEWGKFANSIYLEERAFYWPIRSFRLKSE